MHLEWRLCSMIPVALMTGLIRDMVVVLQRIIRIIAVSTICPMMSKPITLPITMTKMIRLGLSEIDKVS